MNFKIENVKVQAITKEYFKENINLMNLVAKESHFLARTRDATHEDTTNFIRTYSKHSNTIYLIALYEQKLIGHIFSLPRLEDLLGHIVNIGYLVHPDYRKKGVCSILMERLIREAKRKENIKIMVAEVAADNIPSQKLLNRFDFKEFGKLSYGMMKNEIEFVDLLYFSKHLYE